MVSQRIVINLIIRSSESLSELRIRPAIRNLIKFYRKMNKKY